MRISFEFEYTVRRLKLSLVYSYLAGSTLALLAGQEASAPVFRPQSITFFETKVRPILKANCEVCHNSATKSGGLAVDSLDSILKGGDDGPAAKPGSPTDSLIIQSVEQTGALKMPKGKPKLKDDEIAILREWVEQKTPWVSENAGKPRNWEHWAFRPPKRPDVPAVIDKAWVRNLIDNFVLAGLEKENLKPSPEADKATLMRRVCLDLTGLLPTPAEMQALARWPTLNC